MTVRNYSTAGATPVVVQLTNIGEQAPILLLKSWINRHTTDRMRAAAACGNDGGVRRTTDACGERRMRAAACGGNDGGVQQRRRCAAA